jgi:hypothetical protein
MIPIATVSQMDGSIMQFCPGEKYKNKASGEIMELVKIEFHDTEVSGKFLLLGIRGIMYAWKDLSWNFHKDYEKVNL